MVRRSVFRCLPALQAGRAARRRRAERGRHLRPLRRSLLTGSNERDRPAPLSVIPAKAGIQGPNAPSLALATRVRGGGENGVVTVQSDRLLGDGDPAPVRVLRPAGASEFFLTADHAGRAIPQRLGALGLPERELERHIAWDIGIAGVTERLAQALDATAVLQAYSRLVIDCNRQPGWASSIPEISEVTAIPGNEGIAPAEREARHREIFLPYHQRIAELLDGRRAAGRRTGLSGAAQ